MNYFLRPAPPEHYGWLCSRIEYCPTIMFRGIEVLDKDGRIVGMTGFDCWTPNSVHMCMALDRPTAARVLIRPSFEYVFNQQKRGVALAVVSAANERALRADEWLGFSETHRVRDGLKTGIDLVMLEMRREECRWLSTPKEAQCLEAA